MLLWAAYSVGRWVAAQHAGNAFVHADEVWSLERGLQMPDRVAIVHLQPDGSGG